jgi:hypothetical protein
MNPAANGVWIKTGGVAIGNSQSVNGDGFAGANVKNSKIRRATDRAPLNGQLVRTRPVMVTFLSTVSWLLVSRIVAEYVRLKSIVSPSFAAASAWRSEPGSLSLVLLTVIVAA